MSRRPPYKHSPLWALTRRLFHCLRRFHRMETHYDALDGTVDWIGCGDCGKSFWGDPMLGMTLAEMKRRAGL